MSYLNSILKQLEEKLEDLQRDTKFCINNYDYHHKNNEHEIIQNLRDIIKDSLQEGEQFVNNMQNLRSSIVKARKKCSEIDEMLDLSRILETSDETDSCASGSRSFQEQQDFGKYSADVLEENKENLY